MREQGFKFRDGFKGLDLAVVYTLRRRLASVSDKDGARSWLARLPDLGVAVHRFPSIRSPRRGVALIHCGSWSRAAGQVQHLDGLLQRSLFSQRMPSLRGLCRTAKYSTRFKLLDTTFVIASY